MLRQPEHTGGLWGPLLENQPSMCFQRDLRFKGGIGSLQDVRMMT